MEVTALSISKLKVDSLDMNGSLNSGWLLFGVKPSARSTVSLLSCTCSLASLASHDLPHLAYVDFNELVSTPGVYIGGEGINVG